MIKGLWQSVQHVRPLSPAVWRELSWCRLWERREPMRTEAGRDRDQGRGGHMGHLYGDRGTVQGPSVIFYISSITAAAPVESFLWPSSDAEHGIPSARTRYKSRLFAKTANSHCQIFSHVYPKYFSTYENVYVIHIFAATHNVQNIWTIKNI